MSFDAGFESVSIAFSSARVAGAFPLAFLYHSHTTVLNVSSGVSGKEATMQMGSTPKGHVQRPPTSRYSKHVRHNALVCTFGTNSSLSTNFGLIVAALRLFVVMVFHPS